MKKILIFSVAAAVMSMHAVAANAPFGQPAHKAGNESMITKLPKKGVSSMTNTYYDSQDNVNYVLYQEFNKNGLGTVSAIYMYDSSMDCLYPYNRTELAYDSKDLNTNTTAFIWDGTWEANSTNDSEYDSQGRLTHSLEKYRNYTKWSTTEITNVYDKNGYSEITHSSSEGSDEYSKRVYVYDGAGKISSITYSYSKDGKVWTARTKEEYEYKGNTSTQSNYTYSNGEYVLGSVVAKVYDGKGNVTEQASYYNIGGELVLSSKDIMKYDSKGSLIQQDTYSQDQLQSRTEYKYNNNNDIVELCGYYRNWTDPNTLDPSYKYLYEYDAEGVIKEQKYYNYDTETKAWILAGRYVYDWNNPSCPKYEPDYLPCLYLVGTPSGWQNPTEANADHYNNWKLRLTTTGKYYGEFAIDSKDAMFRFYSALTGWDGGDSWGSQEPDNPRDFTIHPENFYTMVNGKGSYNFTNWNGGKMYIVVHFNTQSKYFEIFDNPQDFTFGSGISDTITEASSAPAEYFTIQGVKVENPQPGGLYIVRQGAKASKTILR